MANRRNGSKYVIQFTGCCAFSFYIQQFVRAESVQDVELDV